MVQFVEIGNELEINWSELSTFDENKISYGIIKIHML